MNPNNKETLQKANELISEGDHEGFLSYCTDDTEWTFVGERILQGKQSVREYMKEAYATPPKFIVEHLIAEGDFVTATGEISMKNKNGETIIYSYCDVWEFREGRIAALKAFVIESGSV